MENKNSNMKKAAIENIFIWIVLITMFASIFFFIMKYTVIIRAADRMDAIADYGANYVGVNGIGDDLSDTMNSIASNNFSAMNADTTNICATVSDNQYEVTFNITATNASLFFYSGTLGSSRIVFNQDGTGNSITCDLSVTLQQN